MLLPDRYRLEGGIAAGGMAAVYAAHDTVLNRPVAVKLLADHLNADAVARQRFGREARAAAGLSSHPGVVTIFDVGEHEGRSFLVMERRDGGTLADVVRSEELATSEGRNTGNRVAPDRALRWLHTVADALDAAHAQGVVHRDIKPRNLLLDHRDRVAVADFGIASLAHETERYTQTGQVLGTAAYLSPEQALGEPATPASDRYALAVVAYELLTGVKPFTASHFAAQARAHIEDPPPAAPGLSRAAQAVLRRGLAKDPAARWPSAAAFVEALQHALSEPEAGTAAMVAPPDATRPMPARTRPAPSPSATTGRRVRPLPPAPVPASRRRGPLVALALAALALAAIGVALAASGNGDRPPTSEATATPTPTPTQTPSPTPTPTPEDTATPAPTASPSPSPSPSPTPTTVAATGNPSTLNDRGYALYQQGDYDGAIDPLTRAVAACDGSSALDPCGFAVYNLGSSLHRAGRSQEAIPLLERRLSGWSYKRGIVRQELEAARAAASGQDG